MYDYTAEPDNPTRERARQIIHDIYQKRVKDRDLDHYEFDDNAGQSFFLMKSIELVEFFLALPAGWRKDNLSYSREGAATKGPG